MKHTLLIATFLVVLATPTLAAKATAVRKTVEQPTYDSTFTMEDSGCGGSGNLDDVQCLARYLKWLDAKLNGAYSKAMTALPTRASSDHRGEQEQLRKSQRAWLIFYRENCALEGGLEGGTNLWVTHFSALCEERELKARIRFLERISE